MMEPLRRDPVMAEVIEKHGEIDITPADDTFRRFVRTIINQQLSSASAQAIRERVFDRYEITPEGLRKADDDGLRNAGLSRQKIEYIRGLAEAFQDGTVRPNRFEGMSDGDVINELTEIRGVGVWSAKMYLLFCLGREDVFPVEDLGIRRGMTKLYGIEDRKEMTDKAEEWRPYRSYASRYLWQVSD